MSILDNYYGEGKSIRDKIAELEEENQRLKRAFEIADMCVNNTTNENKKLKSEIRRITNQRDNLKGIADNLVDENRYLEEENRKLKEELGKFIMKA